MRDPRLEPFSGRSPIGPKAVVHQPRPIALKGSFALRRASIPGALEPSPAPVPLWWLGATGRRGVVATSCSRLGQSNFNRAVALLHFFRFSRAIEGFDAVLRESLRAQSRTGESLSAIVVTPLHREKEKDQLQLGRQSAEASLRASSRHMCAAARVIRNRLDPASEPPCTSAHRHSSRAHASMPDHTIARRLTCTSAEF